MAGVVNTTYTFQATDTITSEKMNNIIDETTFTSDAVFGTTLEVVSGKLKVRAQNITSNELASNAVTTDKILNSAITNAKIATGAVTATRISPGGVTTLRLADNAVTNDKLDTNSVATENIQNNSITAVKLNGTQKGNAPIYAVRSAGAITVLTPRTIQKGLNVSEVSRIDSNRTQVTFITNMPNNNYIVIAGNSNISSVSGSPPSAFDLTESGFKIAHNSEGGGRVITFAVIV
jgi:hypothetical protein